jgi:hypothetical protein
MFSLLLSILTAYNCDLRLRKYLKNQTLLLKKGGQKILDIGNCLIPLVNIPLINKGFSTIVPVLTVYH